MLPKKNTQSPEQPWARGGRWAASGAPPVSPPSHPTRRRTINSEIKERWLKALTNGEYKQTTGTLERTEIDNSEDVGFCCLGVLYYLAFLDNVVERDAHGLVYYGSGSEINSSTLPIEVVEWAGLEVDDPLVDEGGEVLAQLSAINDSGTSFNRIAELIDESL